MDAVPGQREISEWMQKAWKCKTGNEVRAMRVR